VDDISFARTPTGFSRRLQSKRPAGPRTFILHDHLVAASVRSPGEPRWGSRFSCLHPGCAPVGRDPGLCWRTSSKFEFEVRKRRNKSGRTTESLFISPGRGEGGGTRGELNTAAWGDWPPHPGPGLMKTIGTRVNFSALLRAESVTTTALHRPAARPELTVVAGFSLRSVFNCWYTAAQAKACDYGDLGRAVAL